VPYSLAAPLADRVARCGCELGHQPHLGYVRRAGVSRGRVAMKRRTNFCAQLSSSPMALTWKVLCVITCWACPYSFDTSTPSRTGVSVSISPLNTSTGAAVNVAPRNRLTRRIRRRRHWPGDALIQQAVIQLHRVVFRSVTDNKYWVRLSLKRKRSGALAMRASAAKSCRRSADNPAIHARYKPLLPYSGSSLGCRKENRSYFPDQPQHGRESPFS